MRRAFAKGGAEASVAAGEFVLELLRPLGSLMPRGLAEKLRAAIAEAAKGDGEMPEGAMLELEGMPLWYHRTIERGRAAGVMEARSEQAAMLLRQVERKFGREAAERLAGVATADASPAVLTRLGDGIIDCDTPEKLLERVENGAP